MILFANKITPRLRYITDFIGSEIFGQPFLLITDPDEYKSASGPRINYSDHETEGDELHLFPHPLLFEEGINHHETACFEPPDSAQGTKVFFKTGGDYPFDIFAASFYLLSRYEEYLPHAKDIYGRFAHESSLAFKENFLQLPLVNIWLNEFAAKMKQRFPSLSIKQNSFRFLPTYDIDEGYCYRYKDWKRSTGGALRDLVKGNWNLYHLRRKVLKGKIADPFDSYDWIHDLHSSHSIKPIYFFLVAEKNGIYDKNILPAEPAMQTIIKEHAAKYKLGLHPSWQSGNQDSILKKEKETLEEISKTKVNTSRQHYIRFTLPHTFRDLIEAGILEDFSMGYGSINGFRASVTSAYYWYDLEKEESTQLLLHPFCFMEANSFFEQRMNAMQALEEMRRYYHEVKKVNGEMIAIWHNTFLGTAEKFSGWREVYAEFFKEVISG